MSHYRSVSTRQSSERSGPSRGQLGAAAAVALVLVVGTIAAVASVSSGPRNPGGGAVPSTLSSRSPSPVAAPLSPSAFADFVTSDRETQQAPTTHRAQSKMWIHDGEWWATMVDPVSLEYRIFRLDWETQAWVDTGVLIDERQTADPDLLASGDHLYTVSSRSGDTEASRARLRRFTYDAEARTYLLDRNFPVLVTDRGAPGIVLAQDSTGQLWVTYIRDRRVWVNRSLGDDLQWGQPFPLDVAGAELGQEQEASAIVAFQPGWVGVMWSNQRDGAMYFSGHRDDDPDEVWSPSEQAVAGPAMADDHIHLKAGLMNGRVFAVTKTSQDEGAGNIDAPLVVLAVREPDGTWSQHLVSRVRERHTRPILILDEHERRLTVVASSSAEMLERAEGEGGVLYAKHTSLDDIRFDSGRGTPILGSPEGPAISNPTSTKQSVNGDTGMVVLAWETEARRYHHATIHIGRTPPSALDQRPPDGLVPQDEPVAQTLVHDDLSFVGDGLPLDHGWLVGRSDVGAEVIAYQRDGDGWASVASVSVGKGVATCKRFPATPVGTLDVTVSAAVDFVGTRDAVLTELRGRGVEAASVRFGAGGMFRYQAGAEIVETDVAYELGTWYRSRITVDIDAQTYDWELRREGEDGPLLIVREVPWPEAATTSVEEVCVRTPAGKIGATIRFDNVVVRRVPAVR